MLKILGIIFLLSILVSPFLLSAYVESIKRKIVLVFPNRRIEPGSGGAIILCDSR